MIKLKFLFLTIILFVPDSQQGDALETKAEKIMDENILSNEVTKLKGEESASITSANKVLQMDTAKDKENENKNIESELSSITNQAEEETSFKVIYNKNRYDVSFPLTSTVMQLKNHLQNIIGMWILHK